MDIMNITAQIIGVAAIIVWNLSIQNKKLENILFYQFLANLLYCIEYFLLGATIALLMNIVSAFRCYLFYYKHKKNQIILKKWLFIFVFLVLIVGALNFNGLISLIPIVITIFYTISSWQKETSWSRIAFLVAAFMWIFYNFYVGAFVGIIGNIIEVISGITSLLRFKKIKT